LKGSIAVEKRDFPDRPGVYIMKDSSGAPIYVGKAKSLKHRVRSYFAGDKDIKTRFLLAAMEDIEVIITNTEYEALLLENNLIKQWKPRYNINLKDGKTYPVIRLTNEEFPRVFRTRRIVFDGSEYFGPFPKPHQIDIYLKLIERHFRLCKYRGSRKSRSYPCLNYHMGRCSGACCGKISREDYLKIVDGVRKLLSGKSDDLLADLREAMKAASEALDFERAAGLRDQAAAIEEVSTEQRVEEFSETDRDYVALAPAGEAFIVVVLQVREGKLLGKEVFRVEEYATAEETLSHFIARYYTEITMRPREIHVTKPVDAEGLSAMLRELSGRKIGITVPQRGKHAQLAAMAEENAREEAAKTAAGADTALALERLSRELGLARAPRKIEGFDIAHLDGTDTVASMVSFRDGRPERKQYRSFTIRSLGGKIDDFESIREAVARRYSRVVNEELERPDLILIDGGKGQLGAAKGILDGLGLEEIPVIGLAKKKEEIFLPGQEDPVVLEEGTPALRILQAVRNESHRFATTLHKRKRAKRVSLALLEGVPGIGKRRSKMLMEVFGSLDEILARSPEEISRESGIAMNIASELLKRLKAAKASAAGAEVNRAQIKGRHEPRPPRITM
jgi:excinuclease ABC subunit C